jgi:hypothetical protein
MEITPAHIQVHIEELFSAGIPPSMTVAEPGVQGATVTGTHGIGVKTPRAAAVAEATVGLASDMHMPKGGMFVVGMLSMILAAGAPIMVLFVGRTFSALGAAPKVHIIMQPEVTKSGIGSLSRLTAGLKRGRPGKARTIEPPSLHFRKLMLHRLGLVFWPPKKKDAGELPMKATPVLSPQPPT